MLIERNANYTDFDFIYSTLLNGARHGHYSVDAENPAMKQKLKDEIHTITSRRSLLDGRYATASIFTRHNDRIALLITCEGIDIPNAFEIYALSVARKHRGNGYGNLVLDKLLERLYRSDITARCSAQSNLMQSMLESRGFEHTGSNNDFSILLRQVPVESGLDYNSSIAINTNEISTASVS